MKISHVIHRIWNLQSGVESQHCFTQLSRGVYRLDRFVRNRKWWPSKRTTVPVKPSIGNTTNKDDGTTNNNDEMTTTSKKRSDEKEVCIFQIIYTL